MSDSTTPTESSTAEVEHMLDLVRGQLHENCEAVLEGTAQLADIVDVAAASRWLGAMCDLFELELESQRPRHMQDLHAPVMWRALNCWMDAPSSEHERLRSLAPAASAHADIVVGAVLGVPAAVFEGVSRALGEQNPDEPDARDRRTRCLTAAAGWLSARPEQHAAFSDMTTELVASLEQVAADERTPRMTASAARRGLRFARRVLPASRRSSAPSELRSVHGSSLTHSYTSARSRGSRSVVPTAHRFPVRPVANQVSCSPIQFAATGSLTDQSSPVEQLVYELRGLPWQEGGDMTVASGTVTVRGPMVTVMRVETQRSTVDKELREAVLLLEHVDGDGPDSDERSVVVAAVHVKVDEYGAGPRYRALHVPGAPAPLEDEPVEKRLVLDLTDLPQVNRIGRLVTPDAWYAWAASVSGSGDDDEPTYVGMEAADDEGPDDPDFGDEDD